MFLATTATASPTCRCLRWSTSWRSGPRRGLFRGVAPTHLPPRQPEDDGRGRASGTSRTGACASTAATSCPAGDLRVDEAGEELVQEPFQRSLPRASCSPTPKTGSGRDGHVQGQAAARRPLHPRPGALGSMEEHPPPAGRAEHAQSLPVFRGGPEAGARFGRTATTSRSAAAGRLLRLASERSTSRCAG